MFENLARFDIIARLPAAGRVRPHGNDNHGNANRAVRHFADRTEPHLACRWQIDPASGRLECRWALEPAEQPAAATMRSQQAARHLGVRGASPRAAA